MEMKRAGFVSVILTGYVAISFGILKIFWRQFGVHFYAPGVQHTPEAGLALDSFLISVIILSGMCLVVVQAVIPALVCLIGAFFFEFILLHESPHSLWQYAFAIGAIAGQVATLAAYLVGYSILEKVFAGIRHRLPPQDI